MSDGSDVPELEHAAVETGEETPVAHAIGLCFWSINWAIETMGGSLSVSTRNTEGTAVCIEIPTQPSDDI